MERSFVSACNTQVRQHIEEAPIDQPGTYPKQISDLIHAIHEEEEEIQKKRNQKQKNTDVLLVVLQRESGWMRKNF
jgi:hypothetical protein